ncbi:hypothetical protein ABZ461_28895 [Actinacidiphila glaucinigra]|uniref:hypothetical protein n=1 Tax=Actinacidiphila glaucinigra TaxID=235986 RepID=UPI0033E3E19D
MDHAGRLAPAGLVFLCLMDLELPLIPPTLANMATGYKPPSGEWPRSVVGRDTPDFVAQANEGWFELSREGGLFGDDREFLVTVPLHEGGNDLWWAHVRLAESWDVVGAGSSAALGSGFGEPEFTALSLAGDVVAFCYAHSAAVGSVLATGFSDLVDLRKMAEWEADYPRTRRQEKAAARRWLDATAG